MQTPLLLIRGYLKGKGADSLPHVKSGSLLDHLIRVSETIARWGLDADAQRVALCHSIYSTSNYKEVLVPESEREDVRSLIGEPAEKLVHAFSRLDRLSLDIDKAYGSFSYIDRLSKEKTFLSEQEFCTLLHVLLANQLDHMDPYNAEQIVASCNIYAKFKPHIEESAWAELLSLGLRAELAEKEGALRFIGHAGLWLSLKDVSLAVDPWLYSSNLETSLIQGFSPGQRTIDYLIPRPVYASADIAPDIVLLSHFHTHHAPLREIVEFATLKPIDVVCPPLSPERVEGLKERLGPEVFSNITFHFCDQDKNLVLKGLTIRVLTHTQPGHLAYLVSHGDSSFMHLADGTANRDHTKITLDQLWDKFKGARPTYLFLSATDHSQRMLDGTKRDILEHRTLSPIQGAKLSIEIGAKNVALVGMYNFSIWDSLIEFTHGAADVESEFAWAMTYLAPHIALHQMRPGDSFPFA